MNYLLSQLSTAYGAIWAMHGQIAELLARITELEAQLSDERAAAARAVHELDQLRAEIRTEP